jgi:hypothetical protein
LGQTDGKRQCRRERVTEGAQDSERGDGVAEHDDQKRCGRCHRFAHHDARIEQHPDRDEEQNGKRVAQWQRLLRGLVTELRFGETHAAEESTEREGDPEQLG